MGQSANPIVGGMLRTRLGLTLWRVAMLYVVIIISQILFYLYNRELIGDISTTHSWELLRGALVFCNVSIVYALAPFLLLAILPLPDKVWCSRIYTQTMYWLYMVATTVVVALNFTDIVYFRYTQKRVTADEFFFANNDNTTNLIFTFLAENWYLVLVALLLIVLVAVGYRRRCVARSLTQSCGIIWLSRVVIMVAVALCTVWGVRGGLTRMTRPITMSNAMLYTQSPSEANLILSNPFCIIRTMSKSVARPIFFSDNDAEALFTPKHYPTEYQSEMFGRYNGYNVVLIILESFSAEHSAMLMPEEHDGAGYTPYLDELMRQSLCFKRCYANGATSIAAPPTIWSSTPSYESAFMLMSESLAECRPMPRLLRDKGYDTAFFCGSEHGSMGFGAYAHIAGIERLYSMDTYVENHPATDFDGKWGIWDEPFLRYMGEELSALEEPFFASCFTLTSHHPFNVPEDVRDELPAGTTLNHRPVAYVDRAIGRFMAQCAEEEWYDNTLFVFIADHVSSERMAERTLNTPGCFHIVGFIYAPDGSLAEEYDHVVAQVDIMPTVLGLVGNTTPYFAMGRDIFNEPQREPFSLIRSGYGYVGLWDDYVTMFDGKSITGVYTYDDIEHQHDISHEVDVERADSVLKATLQQYYKHVAEMDFVVK